jgi:pimeloyl-ACP methyl ester carboxylesterase
MPIGAKKMGSDTWFSFALLCALFAPTCALAAEEEDPPLVTDPIYAAPNRLVEVEPGRRLNLYCLGSGSPTVVFDSGLGGGTTAWSPVQKQIAEKTRACSYDRAGRNFSDPGTRASTSANIVDDLHKLLVAAGEKPPFVLVGHSLGGLNMRLFADTYRDEVVGMVLVDPMHEDQSEKYRALDPAKATREEWDKQREAQYARQRACRDAAAGAGFPEGSEIRKQCHIGETDGLYGPEINAAYARLELKPAYWQGFLSENENAFTTSSDQVRASRRSYGDMPLIVLTRAPASKKKDETQQARDVRTQLWGQMHDDIASTSPRGENRVIPDSTHAIQFDQPAAVIDAVLEVAKKK